MRGCSLIEFKVTKVIDFFQSSPKHITYQYIKLIFTGLGMGLGDDVCFAAFWFSKILDFWICLALTVLEIFASSF